MADSCSVTPWGSAAIPLSDAEKSFQVIEQSVLDLWEVVNNLTLLHPPQRERYRVTVFGSARMDPGSPLYESAKHLASELTRLGCDIITGGGPGLMQAANEGSVAADPDDQSRSIGIRVDLPHEQGVNPFVEQMYCHRTFFSRLHHFVLLSDAFVVLPGGIGTTLEALMVWQLLQVRKLANTPLILVGPMWADLTMWAEQHMLNGEGRLIDPMDISIAQCVKDCDEAIALLRAAHEKWQASA
jgi:uncharacterized protein (TIGR00730 family)